MRRSRMVPVGRRLVACHGSQQQSGPRTVRLAIHQDFRSPFFHSLSRKHSATTRRTAWSLATSEVAGGTKAIEALLGGSVDVAAASMSDAVQLAIEGRDVRGFLLLYTRPTAALAVTPSLSSTMRTVRDLKGRTIGVSAPGSARSVYALLVSNGLSPDAVDTVSVGMSASSVAALEHGSVDAAVLLGSAISVFEVAAAADVSRGSAHARRRAAGVWLRGVPVAGPDGQGELAPSQCRHCASTRPSGHARDAVDTGPSCGAGARHDPEAARMTAEADLHAIRQMQEVLSTDGLMPAGSAS